MRAILVDANVLVSFLTDRDNAQKVKASALFRGAAAQEHLLVIPSVILMEMTFVLLHLYRVAPEEVAQLARELLAMPGVTSSHTVPWSLVLDLWPKTIPSIGDAIVAAVAVQERCDAVATFDKGLRKKLVKQGSVSYWTDR